ncbi:MAG: hypothetical protein COV47_03925 [Candidatus Diapherotrites archaeon CG11_big_fil_rev_8_21_14_0_20_37_9]|nr:MAG: hypothetical protein COV47_03925 [Candidatus Diapherotrites archaeon CG11_big_fil_rev_8_21_14_0_20_37_9]
MFISKKINLKAVVSAVMGHKRNDRAMEMSEWKTRCIKAGDIHELLVSTEYTGNHNETLNSFVYLGFFDFKKGGVIEIGDQVTTTSGALIAEIIGFDDTHLPNHINIVAKSKDNKTGEEFGLKPGQKVFIGAKR